MYCFVKRINYNKNGGFGFGFLRLPSYTLLFGTDFNPAISECTYDFTVPATYAGTAYIPTYLFIIIIGCVYVEYMQQYKQKNII